MAGKFSGDDEVIADINVTPFVDVVLVLLVIFMVTSGFIVNKGMKVDLPEAASAEQLQTQKTFNILVSIDGTLLLDGVPATIQNLGSKAQEAKAGGQKVVAMISADKGVIYNSVVAVMDTLRQAGVSDFALQMEPPNAQQSPRPSP